MDDPAGQASPHYINSPLRESIVEHLFVGEALRRLRQMGMTGIEVLRSEFDAGGGDLMISYPYHPQYPVQHEDARRQGR